MEHAGNKGVYRTSLIDGEFSLNDNYFILNLLKERNLVESQGELYLLEPDQFDLSEQQKTILRSEIETALFLELGTPEKNTLTSFDFSEPNKPKRGGVRLAHLLVYPLVLGLGSFLIAENFLEKDPIMPVSDEERLQELKFKLDSIRATRPTEGDTVTFDLR